MARRPGARYPSDDKRNERRRLERERKLLGAAAKKPVTKAAPAAVLKQKRGPRPVAAPLLAELANEPAAELCGRQLGGVCPNGHAHDDTDKNCRLCGAAVHRVCAHCDQPYDDDSRFCTGCGRDIPQRAAAAPASPGLINPDQPSTLAPSSPAPAAELGGYEWQPEDMSMFAFGVDALLVKLREKPLDDKERDKLLRVMAPVANKHYRPGAKYREEVALVMALGGLLVPALGVYLFVLPDRRKARELEDKDGKPVDVAAEKPKREIKANLEAV